MTERNKEIPIALGIFLGALLLPVLLNKIGIDWCHRHQIFSERWDIGILVSSDVVGAIIASFLVKGWIKKTITVTVYLIVMFCALTVFGFGYACAQYGQCL